MPLLSVSLKSSDIKESLLVDLKPDNWTEFENVVLALLRQQLAGMHIQSLTVDMAQSAHPGPLVLRFNIDSQFTITAAQIKQVLQR